MKALNMNVSLLDINPLRTNVFSKLLQFIFSILTFAILGLPGLLSSSSSAHAAETTLSKALDLVSDAREAQRLHIPILMLYSLPGCPYCESIRRSHLMPMQAVSERSAPRRAIIRQVDLKSSLGMIDFAGQRVTHSQFAWAQNIKFAPVVAFYGKDAMPLTEPLMGTMLPDFYSQYLEDALAVATLKLIPLNRAK